MKHWYIRNVERWLIFSLSCSIFASARSPLKHILYSVKHGWISRKLYDILIFTPYINVTFTFTFKFYPVGFYSSGLYWGRIVDSHGPRIPLACSFLSLLVGFSGIKYFYDFGLPAEAKTLSNMGFSILVFCAFLTGCGGGGGFAATVNSTAKSFPDRAVRLYNYNKQTKKKHCAHCFGLSVGPQLV